MKATSRLHETATLDATTYQQCIQLYKGSDASKALAARFCFEFESELQRLGYHYKAGTGSISKAVWVSPTTDKLQDVIQVFNKAGIDFVPDGSSNGAFKYCAVASINLPRFGGITTIHAMAYQGGAAGLSVSFSFFGD